MSITLNNLAYSFAGFIQKQVARYLNTDAGTANGFRTLTGNADGPNVNGDYKVRWKLVLPVVDEREGCCNDTMRQSSVDIVATVPSTATAAERTTLANSIKDLAASPEFQASVTSLISPSA